MRILVIGLDCAAPELLFGDEQLVNIRRLMECGCHGRLESVIPPITVPAWMCMATSRDPGTLGLYGFRNRVDHSYAAMSTATSRSVQDLAVWDQVAREGKRAHVIGVPPSYPARKVSGISVGCFLTPDVNQGDYTHPSDLASMIHALVGEYPVDVRGFRTPNKDWLLEQVYDMTRKHFCVVRHIMESTPWDYLQFVEIGLDRMHHGFWKYHDPQHRQHEPGNPYEDVIRDYYRCLDDEIGHLLELLDEETVVLVASDHGAQRLEGGFCVNEFLIREGFLVLDEYPSKTTPFSQLSVNWSKTTAWSEGGYYARVFLNVQGREPQGVISPNDYEKVRDDLKARLEATLDDRGRPMGTLVFKPEETFCQVNNVAPDLMVHFGALDWRSVGSVGHGSLHVQENDTGPDDCNHAQHGAFVLAAPNCPLVGQLEGAHLLDLAPTLLELAGYDPLPAMQGRSLLAGRAAGAVYSPFLSPGDEEVVRERLAGLGYA
jgi:predicted AlkP superfamily phosphohydrolase/phosphomutase